MLHAHIFASHLRDLCVRQRHETRASLSWRMRWCRGCWRGTCGSAATLNPHHLSMLWGGGLRGRVSRTGFGSQTSQGTVRWTGHCRSFASPWKIKEPASTEHLPPHFQPSTPSTYHQWTPKSPKQTANARFWSSCLAQCIQVNAGAAHSPTV